MKLALWIILIIAIVSALPYARFVLKRLKCLQSISSLCKKKGFRVVHCGKHGVLRYKSGMYIETPNVTYVIRLLGIKNRKDVLILWEDGRYSVRKVITVFSYGTGIHLPSDSNAKSLPCFDLKYSENEEVNEKTIINVLLVNPVSYEFRIRKNSGEEYVINDGDCVNNVKVCSLRALLRDLESKG